MGKKSGPTPPPAPDPRVLAETDAEFNRIDQFTPQGSLTFGGPSRNQATLTLTPEMQEIFETQLGLDLSFLNLGQDRLGDLDPNPINLDQFGPIQTDAGLSGIDLANQLGFNPGAFGLGPNDLPEFQNTLDLSGLPEIPQDFDQLRSDQEDAFFQRGRRLLNPEFERQEDRLTQTLANQGLFAGDEAAGQQQQIFGENRNRTFQDLADQSILRGGDEASRELARILGTRGQGFNEALGQGQFFNQAALSDFGSRLGAFGASTQGLQNLLGATGFNNTVGQQNLMNMNAGRAQGINEQQAIRSNQFNELASLLGLQQTQQPGLQNFFTPGQVDVMGAQALNQNQLNQNFQAEMARNNAGMGGLFGLGSSLISGAGAAAGGGAGATLLGGFK